MDKIQELQQYLYDYFSSRSNRINKFYEEVSANRREKGGIYELEKGNTLLDLVSQIDYYIGEKFPSPKLIPVTFVTPEALVLELNWFKNYLNNHQECLDLNIHAGKGEKILNEIQSIKNEVIQAIDYSIAVFDQDDHIVLYKELHEALKRNDVKEFIKVLEGVLASVSYAISHSKEGFYHSNVHLILKLTGFEIKSEPMTSNGRIDAVIRHSNRIYIIEFKFHKNKDLSQKALQQIIDKKYASEYLLEKKEVIGIGVSFGIDVKNINGFKVQQLS